MRFFNLDLHIGVIGDIKQILVSLGHEVTDWNISYHTWVLGRAIDKVDVVNEKTWMGLDRAMCDAFYERYRDELAGYDGFIVTHTPCFAMLYERWNKPVICVASTRYEHPFSDDRAKWEEFNEYLRVKIDAGLVIPIANNRYDAEYAEYFTGRAWRVIPSLCEYTGSSYTGERPEALYYSKYTGFPGVDGLMTREQFYRRPLAARVLEKMGMPAPGKRGYDWKDLAKFRAVVHMPYNASVMSIFEMYTAGIPMLFPTLRYAMTLYPENKLRGVFSELSFNQVRGLPSRSILPSDGLDPNDYEDVEVMAHWIAKADFYDAENLDGLVYYDSFEEMVELLRGMDVGQVHERMAAHARVRRERVYASWAQVMTELSDRLGLAPAS